ncbi:hypothetical protein [Mycetocola miduiensis]|uniref:Uncharacterized protein n=1 Tax=Mycetocola miduiensis TaxID=995034 RepID=A0A1I5ATV4_9MICO|nr:hypothetical protein [Mycetocola miduiensis]SFN65888.1 hypothetical protein SAMN05216219_1539 [Mycetocola miduiensis]
MPDQAAPETTISPKVIAQAVTGVALTALVAGIAAVTPDHFASLGIWGPIGYAAIVSIGGSIAGYIKRDPLRGTGTS